MRRIEIQQCRLQSNMNVKLVIRPPVWYTQLEGLDQNDQMIHSFAWNKDIESESVESLQGRRSHEGFSPFNNQTTSKFRCSLMKRPVECNQ